MTHPYFHHSFINRLLPFSISNKSLLDVDFGRGIWGYMIKADREVANSHIIGLDLSIHYLNFANYHRIYDSYILASATHLPLRTKSINIVLGIEVIEHLSKENGQFLSEIGRVCKEVAILSTPNI